MWVFNVWRAAVLDTTQSVVYSLIPTGTADIENYISKNSDLSWNIIIYSLQNILFVPRKVQYIYFEGRHCQPLNYIVQPFSSGQGVKLKDVRTYGTTTIGLLFTHKKSRIHIFMFTSSNKYTLINKRGGVEFTPASAIQPTTHISKLPLFHCGPSLYMYSSSYSATMTYRRRRQEKVVVPRNILLFGILARGLQQLLAVDVGVYYLKPYKWIEILVVWA